MILSIPYAPLGRRLVLLTSLVFLVAGCHGTHVEEAEHHTPAHKPPNYSAAVDRLLALHVEFGNSGDRTEDQLDALSEAYDVVRWLPELAADSDLEEQPWIRVENAARRLEAIMTHVLSCSDDQRYEMYFQYETELEQHQRALIDVKSQFPAADKLASGQSS